MKRISSLVLALSLLISCCALLSTTAYAADQECGNPNYVRTYNGKEFISDICTNCGYVRVHWTPYTLPFIIRDADSPARKEPRGTGKEVKRYSDFGTPLQVVGRVRNEFNNLWLYLSDGSYIFADHTAFDFDAMASKAVSSVNVLASPTNVCYLSYSPQRGLQAQCTPSTLGIYGSMFVHFQPGGEFDLKRTELLGLNTYKYYVYACGHILNDQYTGENLGNILYGYVCKKEGISTERAIKYAGAAETSSLGNLWACFVLNDLSRCDDENDIKMIRLGWNYSNSKKWE